MILAKHYKEGITAMHALGHDAHPDVANYIGYAYRKMGDYADSKIWYEKALAADPKHVRTWSYYGMWQMEQGHPTRRWPTSPRSRRSAATPRARNITNSRR